MLTPPTDKPTRNLEAPPPPLNNTQQPTTHSAHGSYTALPPRGWENKPPQTRRPHSIGLICLPSKGRPKPRVSAARNGPSAGARGNLS